MTKARRAAPPRAIWLSFDADWTSGGEVFHVAADRKPSHGHWHRYVFARSPRSKVTGRSVARLRADLLAGGVSMTPDELRRFRAAIAPGPLPAGEEVVEVDTRT